MTKYLIVTADDLGLSESINEGIAKSLLEGIVTAVSIIPTGEALDDAVKRVNGLPIKGVGAHLALTETKPILSSTRFYKNHTELFLSLFSGRIDMANVYSELKAQLELLRSKGLNITHINSHEHLHLEPRILDIFIRLAKEYGIKIIRFPRIDRVAAKLSIKERYRSALLGYFSNKIKDNLADSGLIFTDSFMGLLDSGRLNIDKIKNILRILKPGVTELVTHPGFLSPQVLEDYYWHLGSETELFALTDRRVKDAIAENDIRLISFEEFLSLRG